MFYIPLLKTSSLQKKPTLTLAVEKSVTNAQSFRVNLKCYLGFGSESLFFAAAFDHYDKFSLGGLFGIVCREFGERASLKFFKLFAYLSCKTCSSVFAKGLLELFEGFGYAVG